jgi:voltage-dependent potassium channel beta subunit
MNYRKLGRNSVRVSEVSLGGWLTHGRTVDDAATARIVHHAFDQGVNFFDTADAYHAGAAEIALGKAIQSISRPQLVIGTKCFFPMSDKPNDRGLGRKHIFESVHASLQRLGTDYLDLMQFHRYDHETPLEETVRAIDDLIRQGKVLYWGVSEWSPNQIVDACHIAKSMNAMLPASNQPQYHMLNRWIEGPISEVCQQFGLGLVVFSPLAQGVLTGKYLPGTPAPEGTRAADDSSNMFMDSLMQDSVLERVQQAKTIVEAEGFSMAQFALAWCLRLPHISSVIIGASNTGQVDTNVAASGVTLSADLIDRVQNVLEGKG